jgi:hypothetical protein
MFSDYIRIKCLRFRHKRLGNRIFQMQFHQCKFFCYAGALIDLLFNHNILQSPPRMWCINTSSPHSFECLHPFINFSLYYAVTAILRCHSSVNFTRFHALRSQQSDRRPLLFLNTVYQWSSHVTYSK